MAIHIQQVLDYLDAHPVCKHADTVTSLLEMLHDAYAMHNRIDSEKLRGLFQQMRSVLDLLPLEESDNLCSLVCDLCIEQEQLAFSHGILVGMHLMTEVNCLP